MNKLIFLCLLVSCTPVPTCDELLRRDPEQSAKRAIFDAETQRFAIGDRVRLVGWKHLREPPEGIISSIRKPFTYCSGHMQTYAGEAWVLLTSGHKAQVTLEPGNLEIVEHVKQTPERSSSRDKGE